MRRFAAIIILAGTVPVASLQAKEIQIGDRVLTQGRFQRKCSAHVDAIPAPGFAKISFDHPGCGDAGQPYEFSQLQAITFLDSSHLPGGALRAGDDVVVKGFLSSQCSARVREVSRTGYVNLDFDSLLCADTEALRKASELRRIHFVKKIRNHENEFEIGQKITLPGPGQHEACSGKVTKLTDNGLAAIAFDELTCAVSGRLYSLDQLSIVETMAPHARDSAEVIFDRVMREIATEKKNHSKQAQI